MMTPTKRETRRSSWRTLNALVYFLIVLAVFLGGMAAWRRHSQRRRPGETASEPHDAAERRIHAFMPDPGLDVGLVQAGALPQAAAPARRFVCPQCRSRCWMPPGSGCPACPFCGRAMSRQGLAVSPAAATPVGGGAAPIAIGADAIRPHSDRGLCRSCHTIAFSGRGVTIAPVGGLPALGVALPIPIRPGSTPLHADRGACTNCHTIAGSRAPRSGITPVGAAAWACPPPVQLAATTQLWPSPAPPRRGAVAPLTTPNAVGPALIKEFGIEVRPAPGSGVQVTGVMGSSYASNAGLRAGDIIIECNEKRVRSVEQFQQLVSLATPEADAQIRIMRNGRARDLLIMVGEGEMEGFTPIRRL